MVVWAPSNEPLSTLQTFKEQIGVTYPILEDNQGVHDTYSQLMAFPTAAYPQDWVIGVDGKVAYANNGYEPDEIIAVLEQELARVGK